MSKFSPHNFLEGSSKKFTVKKRSLVETKKRLQKTEKLTSIQIKEFCFLYIILNNLNLFYQRIDLIEETNLFTKENVLIFDKIIESLKEGNYDNIEIDRQLLDQINDYANIKHIVQKNDKDENKVIEILNDIKQDLKTYNHELRIKELESKFAKDFNQNTFDEINRLKKKQNIN